MRPPTLIPESRVLELEGFRKQKWSGFEHQRFLCVWLRLFNNLSTSKIAKIVGWNVNTVRLTQKGFIDRGVVALTEGKKGGRYNALMTPEEEKLFMSSFVEQANNGALVTANEIKRAMEKQLGQSVHKTTVYRMLKRNGWRKIMPRPSHPKKDKNAGLAFKKRASPKK
jgi:transposase